MVGIITLALIVFSNSLNVDVWVDKENASYYPTEELHVFFQANRDCYVAIYNSEKGGSINKLFPLEDERGWIEAHRIYELPPTDADYAYVIEGPANIEKIIALASEQRLPDLEDQGPDIISSVIEIHIKEAEPAQLRIVATPPNCRIYVTDTFSGNEKYYGKTPETLILRPGEYIVTIKKTGFRTLTRKVWFEPGEKRSVSVQLTPYWY